MVTQRKDVVRLQPGVEYTSMGVRWHGNGAYDRGSVTTDTVKAKTLRRAHAGDFVFNRIDTQKGAFDVVPESLDGALVTNEFPLYITDPGRVLAEFLLLYFQQESVLEKIASSRAGSEGRARWKEADFESWSVPLPSLAEQDRIVNLIASVDAVIGALTNECDSLRSLRVNRNEELFAEFADSSTERRLSEVLTEIKRPVAVDPSQSYRQIGVRSHGRGIFKKEAVTGADLGSKKVYWVEPGDLVFNIVFAWEGAVAIIPPELVGYCGSHRFPTYRRLDGQSVDFLRFYFSTAAGVRLLADCSPGGAGRNRTLNRRRLMDATIPMPDADAEHAAVDELRSLEVAVTAAGDELAHLRAFRSALLGSLLSQEIAIPESYDSLLEKVS